MSQTTRAHGRHVLLAATSTGLVIGFGAGLLASSSTASVPGECTNALNAADSIVKAVDAEWGTASGAVDAVQKAVAESDYRRHAAACRD